MERLSHDLNLALEESNCGKQGRRKFGLRRRTRSAGNLPACIIGITEDGSSSSPPQPPIISQVLSDSDDPQLNQLQQSATKSRATHFCPIGNIESDSFNENFSPTKPPNARRKRKFKKMAIEYSDNNSNGRTSPSLLVGPSHINLVTNCSILNVQGPSPLALINKKKRIFKHNCQDGYRSNIFCGKRKWSHRERSEVGEMRERSFSGGCTSKSYFFSKGSPKSYLDFKNSKKLLPLDKVPKFKEKHGVVAKSAAVKNGIESALQTINLSALSEKPMLGSSTFNFVYRCPTNKNSSADPASVIKIATELPPFFAPKENECDWGSTTKIHHKKHDKSHNGKHKSSQFKSNPDQLRNPLQFDDQSLVMDCSVANELLSSSSLSSSDSEGVVTNDSDREGDDELTDWPGNEEISSFTKSLNFQKVQRPYPNNAPFKTNVAPATKPTSKKDKFLPKQGLSSCKNKTEAIFNKTDLQESGLDMQLMDEDTLMSDSGSVLDTYACNVTRSHSDLLGPSNSHTSFTSFSDVKNAGLQNNNANEAFFHSFQAFQDKAKLTDKNSEPYTPRSNFHLQKTSSSDLNLSEKSPQSDHCYSEHSACFGTPEIREIRAGCRRIRDERPGFTILSAANEQLSKFLRDPCQDELKLPCFSNDHEEKEKLACLAKLYSLELQVEMGRPVLRKTINTTQSVRMEHTRFHRQKLLSEFKRRCYGNDCNSDQVLDSLTPSLLGSVDLCKQSSSMEPDICIQSTSSAVNSFDPYASLTKASTIDDLSASQDYDQGFSEPAHLHDVGNLATYKNGLESLRPDLLSHIPLGASLTDSSSIDLAELD